MDADSLRAMITAGPLLQHKITATSGQACCCACDRTWRDSEQYRLHLAQAVIDALGLTVETAMDEQYGLHARVVGKWGVAG